MVSTVAKLPKIWVAQSGSMTYGNGFPFLSNDTIPGGGITGETISRVELTIIVAVQVDATSQVAFPQVDLLWGLYNGTSITPDPNQHNTEPRSWLLRDIVVDVPVASFQMPLSPPTVNWIQGSVTRTYSSEGQRAQGGLHTNFRIAARDRVVSPDVGMITTFYWHIRFLKTLHDA